MLTSQKGRLLLPFQRVVVLDIEFLVDGVFSFSPFKCHPPAFWPPWFLMGNQLLTFLRLPCT